VQPRTRGTCVHQSFLGGQRHRLGADASDVLQSLLQQENVTRLFDSPESMVAGGPTVKEQCQSFIDSTIVQRFYLSGEGLSTSQLDELASQRLNDVFRGNFGVAGLHCAIQGADAAQLSSLVRQLVRSWQALRKDRSAVYHLGAFDYLLWVQPNFKSATWEDLAVESASLAHFREHLLTSLERSSVLWVFDAPSVSLASLIKQMPSHHVVMSVGAVPVGVEAIPPLMVFHLNDAKLAFGTQFASVLRS
jgi:hypothetical protein